MFRLACLLDPSKQRQLTTLQKVSFQTMSVLTCIAPEYSSCLFPTTLHIADFFYYYICPERQHQKKEQTLSCVKTRDKHSKSVLPSFSGQPAACLIILHPGGRTSHLIAFPLPLLGGIERGYSAAGRLGWATRGRILA